MAKAIRLASLVLALVLAPALAHAQLGIYQPRNPATGERYNFEFSFGYWDAAPNITIAATVPPIVGTEIDGVADLGFQRKKVPDLHFVLRPARKHKIRFEYLPISYGADTVLSRDISFNGVTYTLNVPISSTLDWKAYRFGYEYDFIYRDMGFVGVMGTVEYAQLRASLKSPLANESLDESEPIPAIGAVARGYLTRKLSVTGEFSYFKLPHNLIQDANGHYIDYDVYGTMNFSDYVGVQGGYRSRDAWIDTTTATGNLKLKGYYLRGVFRF